MRMQAFVASLGGTTSEEYCPDYLPLVQAALADYYWPEDGTERGNAGGKPPRRATGAPLVGAEEARVTSFLEAAGAYRFSIRHRGGRLALKPSSSRKVRGLQFKDRDGRPVSVVFIPTSPDPPPTLPPPSPPPP